MGTQSTFDSPLLVRAGLLLALVVAFQVLISNVDVNREMKRRLQHALTGHALVQISHVLPRTLALVLLGLGSVGMYILHQYFPSQFLQAFGGLLRPNESVNLPGAFWFLVGTTVTVLLVDDWVIIRYAVECLALADPMASYVGSTIPSQKINSGSSISGCLACFGTAWVVGQWMLPDSSNFKLLVGALACTIAEASTFGNDNLNIPVLTALAVKYLGSR
jgi:dolichol kinase